jgi:hypothetical protein
MLAQEEINNLNIPAHIKAIEFVVNNLLREPGMVVQICSSNYLGD